MYLGAALRRFSRQGGLLVGLASTTVLVSTAAGSYGTAAAAAPYPPTPSCALSWTQVDDTAGNADHAVLIGSGYDSDRPVAVTAYPQARTVSSIVTDSTGAFEVPVAVTAGDASTWYTANTIHRTCSVVPPTSTTTPGGGAPTAGVPAGGSGGTTAPAGGTNGGSTAGGATTGSGAGGSGAGTGNGGTNGGTTSGGGAGAAGSGGGTGSTGSPYPPSSSSGSKTGSGSSTSTPGSAAPSQPSRSTSAAPPNADTRLPSTLGLPLSMIITIAALLLLAGGLAVLFLTRRAG